MRNLSLLCSVVLFLPACTKGGLDENLRTNENLRVEAGAYETAESSKSFLPYAENSILIFRDSLGEEYTFSMGPIARSSDFDYTSTFEELENPQRKIDYHYTGDRYAFEFVNPALGAKFEIVLRPSICSNPNLVPEGKVLDHLQINGRGFNSYDILARTPVLDIRIPSKSICGGGKKFGRITMLDKEFDEVYYDKLIFASRSMEIYYSPQFGIVGFRTPYMFAVLDKIL